MGHMNMEVRRSKPIQAHYSNVELTRRRSEGAREDRQRVGAGRRKDLFAVAPGHHVPGEFGWR